MTPRLLTSVISKVSQFGFGTIKMTRANSSILRDAIAKNKISRIDTADCYLGHESEKAVGEVIKDFPRKKLFLSTKCGIIGTENGCVLNGEPSYIMKSCRESLARLQTNYIDCYYLHRIDPKVPIEKSMQGLVKLKEEGLILSIGLSDTYSVDQIERAHRIHPIKELQIEYSPWSRHDELNGVIATCRRLGIQVVCYSPLGRGIFTEKTVGDFKAIPTGDELKLFPRYTGENLEKNMLAQAKLKDFAHAKGHKLAPFILAWEMSKGFVVIPATLNPTHLEENLESLQIKIDEETQQSFEKLLDDLKFVGERYPDREHSNIYPEGFVKPSPLTGLSIFKAISPKGSISHESKLEVSITPK